MALHENVKRAFLLLFFVLLSTSSSTSGLLCTSKSSFMNSNGWIDGKNISSAFTWVNISQKDPHGYLIYSCPDVPGCYMVGTSCGGDNPPSNCKVQSNGCLEEKGCVTQVPCNVADATESEEIISFAANYTAPMDEDPCMYEYIVDTKNIARMSLGNGSWSTHESPHAYLGEYEMSHGTGLAMSIIDFLLPATGYYELFMSFPQNSTRIDFLVPATHDLLLPYVDQTTPSRPDLVRNNANFQLFGTYHMAGGSNGFQFSNSVSHDSIVVDAFMIKSKCDFCGRVWFQDNTEAIDFSVGTGWKVEDPGNKVFGTSVVTTPTSDLSMLIYTIEDIPTGLYNVFYSFNMESKNLTSAASIALWDAREDLRYIRHNQRDAVPSAYYGAIPLHFLAVLNVMVAPFNAQVGNTGTIGAGPVGADLIFIEKSCLDALIIGGDLGNQLLPIASSKLASRSWIDQNGFLPPMKIPRADGPAVAICGDSNLYVAGGRDTGIPLETAAQYSFYFNTWQDIASMGTERYHTAGVCLGDGKTFLVVGGVEGSTDSATCEKFNIAAGKWFPAAPMSHPRIEFAAVLYRGYAVSLGGYWTKTQTYHNDAEKYNNITNTWSSFPSFKTGRSRFGAAVVLDKIYISGGYNKEESSTALTSVEVFNGRSWARLASNMLSGSRKHHASVAISNTLVIIGGSRMTVDVYDPLRDEWSTLSPLTQEYHAIGAVSFNPGYSSK